MCKNNYVIIFVFSKKKNVIFKFTKGTSDVWNVFVKKVFIAQSGFGMSNLIG